MTTRRRALAAGAAMLAALTAPACGESSAPRRKTGLEKSNLKVGVLPTWDAAALFLGAEQGFFTAEGLTVTPTVMVNGDDALTRTMSGALDVAHNGYPTPIMAAFRGARIRIVADASQAKPGMYVVVTPGRSAIHRPADLAGKKIGVTNNKGLPALLTAAALRAAGVDPNDVQLIDTAYPDMGAALQNHSVDAVFATDPFLTRFKQALGARIVLDTINGPTADFPIGLYHASERFVKQHPNTTAAFRRAMAKAQTFAAKNRDEVARALPGYIKGLTLQTARTIALGTFATSLSRTRAQRVADFMTQQKALPRHFDVGPMLHG